VAAAIGGFPGNPGNPGKPGGPLGPDGSVGALGDSGAGAAGWLGIAPGDVWLVPPKKSDSPAEPHAATRATIATAINDVTITDIRFISTPDKAERIDEMLPA
jgi:hypothetical protein